MGDAWFIYAAIAVIVVYRWWNGRRRKRRPVPAFHAGEKLGIRRAAGVNHQPVAAKGEAMSLPRRKDLIESLCEHFSE